MRRHIKYERLLAVYHDLDPAARASVDAHLRECPACAARGTGYERMEQSLRELPELRLPSGLQRPWIASQAGRMPAALDRRQGGLRLVLGRALLSAGLITLLIVGSWLLFSLVSGSDHGVTATPTLTLTPTATAVAFLGEDGAGVVCTLPVATMPRRAPVPAPAPPRVTDERVSVALYTP